MLNRFLLFIIICLIFTSCHSSKKNSPEASDNKKDTAQEFLPVMAFIQNDLSSIDSMPTTPLKVVTFNGKPDSTWVDRTAVKNFAQPFLQFKIDTATLGKYFKEESFVDLDVNAITFFYNPKAALPDTMSLKRWHVYLNPKTQAFEKAFFDKEESSGGEQRKTLFTWHAKHWCSITYVKEKDGKTEIRDEKMIWNLNSW